MPDRKPHIIAHRGARAHAPENTLASARLGHAEGAWMWELDTRYTRDKILVVFHDETLERTTDVASRPEFADRAPWHVRDFTLAELRTLDAGSFFAEGDPFGTIAAGEVSAEACAAFRGEPIPTLKEALELVRDLDWRVNVEIKDHFLGLGHDTIARDVCSVIRETGVAERTVLSSFQHVYLLECADLLPDMPRAALVKKPRPLDPAAACRAARSGFYHPDKAILEPGEVDALREQGIKVNVWTVNSLEDMKVAVVLGVHGIITDFPRRLKDLLEVVA